MTHDKYNTPTGSVYGIEIIANAISTMMNGAPLRPASTLVESLVTALFLVALLVTSAVRGLAGRVFAALGVYLVYIAAVGALYVYLGLVVSMTYPMLAGLVTLVAMSMRLFMIAEKSQAVSAADSAESSRMLGLANQGQGQLDAAFEKYRRCPPEENTYNLIYNLGLDYERKRQYNKA